MAIACVLALLAVAGGGCKPTEGNYRSAYDKAYEANKRKNTEATTAVDGTKLEMMDGPNISIVEGDTLYISRERVSPVEAAPSTPGVYGVAIGRYGMPTNARRQVQELSATSPSAFMAKDGDDNYYVIIRTVETLPEARDVIKDFHAAHPGYPSIGLPQGPVVVTVLRK